MRLSAFGQLFGRRLLMAVTTLPAVARVAPVAIVPARIFGAPLRYFWPSPHLLASLPLRTSTCSFLLLHLAPPLLLLPGRHLLNSPPIFCSLRIAFCIPFILRPTSSVLLCRSVAPVPASAGWVDQQTGRRPAGAGGPLPLHRQRPRAHSSRPTHTTPWGRGGVPNLARGMSLRTQVHLVRLSVLHPRVRWGPLPPPQVLRTSIYLQSNKEASSYLQSKLRSSIGSSIGPVSPSPPLACDDDVVVYPVKKKNRSAQHTRLQRELATLRLSLQGDDDKQKLVSPLKKKNRLVQHRRIQCEVASLLAWIAARRAAEDKKEKATETESDFLCPLPVPTGSNARVIHAHDRRGSVPALPARAARLERINLAHYARLIVLLLLLIFPVVFGAGSDDATGKVPVFSGTPTDFHPWFILFSAYVAWKLTEASDILSGQEPKPVVPAPPISTPGTPSGDVAITNATAVSEAKAALAAWNTKITRSFMA